MPQDRDSRPPTPYHLHLGIEVTGAADGQAEARMVLRPELCNRRGVAHGGAVASLLDAALGAAVISGMRPEEWCGTAQLSVQYLEPARNGPLVARGRLLRRGRRLALATGEVFDAAGERVATAHGCWAIWPRHPDAPSP